MSGSYLTATSTYFKGSDPKNPSVCATCALYGIFSSDSTGPAVLSNLYADNFSDSGMYVGACQRVCNVTIDHAWMEDNALGYSGTNSGGRIIIENSMFDDNKEGFDTNTALTGDPPPPQDGRCTGAGSRTRCWVFTHNTLQNNNNPNVPISGTAGLGPTGTGMTISGGRYDTITNNIFIDNGAWGMAFVPYPEGNLTSDGRTCRGTGGIVATSPQDLGTALPLRPLGRHVVQQHVLWERILRQPRQRRLRQPHRRRRPAGELLLGQRRIRRLAVPRARAGHQWQYSRTGILGRPRPPAGL